MKVVDSSHHSDGNDVAAGGRFIDMFPRVLIVEPDAVLQESLRLCLECEGFRLSSSGDYGSALTRVSVEPFDLVIVDHGASSSASHRLCQDVRQRALSPSMAIVLLVAPMQRHSAIELLDSGVDAFVVKPVAMRELVARLRAILRRTARHLSPSTVPRGAVVDNGPVQIRDLDIDMARRRVRVSGEELRLTEQEFQLLYFLANRPGRVFARQALLDALWGDDAHVTLRSVDTLVKRLRQRLRVPRSVQNYVQTVRGVGYRFVETGEASDRGLPRS